MIVDTDKPAEKTADASQATTIDKAPAAKPKTPRAAKTITPPVARKPRVSDSKSELTATSNTADRASPASRPAAGKKSTVKPAPSTNKKRNARNTDKVKKPKLVRDSFTMPKKEYSAIATLKERCLNSGMSPKKSEILRAAITNLSKLSDASLVAAIRKLDAIKTGRPSKKSK